MGLLRSIFSTPENVGKVVDAAISTGDKIWYTEEEKAEGRQRLSDWYLKYLEATKNQSLARRVLAFGITGMWIVLVMLGVLVYPISTEYSKFIFNTVKDLIADPVNIIVGFYFLTHTLQGFKGAK